MQAIKDFLSKINIRNVPLIGTLYATIDNLFGSRRGVIAVTQFLITLGLAITPAAHEVFVPAAMITGIVSLMAIGGYSFTDAKLILQSEVNKTDFLNAITEILDTMINDTREGQPTMTHEEVADKLYGTPEAIR
jgi:hypothetical protein